MGKIIIHRECNDDLEKIMQVCPFQAIEQHLGRLTINAACKMCQLCVKQMPEIFEYLEEEVKHIDKSMWKDIAVYVEVGHQGIHPVSFELLNKARSMANYSKQSVHAIVVGKQLQGACEELMHYDVDKILSYDHPHLENFKIEPYTAVLANYIHQYQPAVFLIGGTNIGRSLAPRVAARFKTGLTADCTVLDIGKNLDLDQIRPAFGGNIMAHIHTPNHRPQFATVRYKVFDTPKKIEGKKAEITQCSLEGIDLSSKIKVIDVYKKIKSKNIEDAEVLVVAGAGVKNEEGLNLVHELASLLQGEVACTRPLIESGIMDAKLQIGLSGRTVRPKLIITCGVSGSVQFVAGMSGAETIISINQDTNANIFDVAHIGLVGDLYEILPQVIAKIKNSNEQIGGDVND